MLATRLCGGAAIRRGLRPTIQKWRFKARTLSFSLLFLLGKPESSYQSSKHPTKKVVRSHRP